MSGGDGNDFLSDSLGKDTLIGGKGDDIYITDGIGDTLTEAANQGRDQVVSTAASFTLGANFEDLSMGDVGLNGTGNGVGNGLDGNKLSNKLDGAAGNDELFGEDGNDTLLGGAGDDTLDGGLGKDSLDGGAGNDVLTDNIGGDTMKGGAGNDSYTVLGTNSSIIELANGGIDEVFAVDTSFSLAALGNVENLTLVGTSTVGTGNNLSNRIRGNNDINQLEGGKGNDTLDGGGGADILIGGLGNDTYVVDTGADQVIEGFGNGKDKILSFVTFNLTNADDVEDLTLTGAAGISGLGNNLANLITGNSGGNRLEGGDGNDTLAGGEGDDTLAGGLGKDVLAGGKENDVYSLDDVGDTLTELVGQGRDRVESSLKSFTLGANFEDLTLKTGAVDGTGNGLANEIRGNGVGNRLDGGAGDDDLNGNGGNDTLIGNTGNDELNGGAAFDVLNGGTGNDVLIDDFGNDTLTGGAGNDRYVVHAANIVNIVELANGGIDEVQAIDGGFSLFDLKTIENLTLLGVGDNSGLGNQLANKITGNAGATILNGLGGNDTLDGGDGIDTLLGDLGNDTYIIADSADQIFESAGKGHDKVLSSVTFTLAADQEIEDLTLTGLGGINGTGNKLANVVTGNGGFNGLFGEAGNDTLNGAGGSDTLVGGPDNDVMIGGKDNDFYFVDSAGDKLIEAANQGEDVAIVSQLKTFTLGANIENLVLSTGAINGTGNSLGNEITGNALINKLDGGAGNDDLDGGDGNDLLLGGLGNDTLEGGIGDDDLFGGAGDDVLEGGIFGDRLTGGAGKDIFLYRLDDPDDLSQLGIDLIDDFSRGSDKIDLRDLLEDFDIDPATAFSGGHILLRQQDGDTVVSFDVVAGGLTDGILAVVTGVTLTESDFLI
ncbi:MAG: hypothetical protein C0484_10995 [Rhodospirillum sp.]|nr:hypothetical protein [Rhodospirillum sp.]